MIIEVDEYKKKVPGYNPKKSELFHSASAKIADKDFIAHLKSGKYKRIIFMAGGTASGKTEFATSYLNKNDQLVYDGTMKNIDGLKIKLKNIKRYVKNSPRIKVVLIIPESTQDSFAAFLQRERKMENKTFFNTHIRSKISLSKILIETEIDVEIYTSKVATGSDNLEFTVLKIDDRSNTAKDLIIAAKSLYNVAQHLGVALDINFDTM